MPEPRRRRTAFAATVLRTERLSASLVRLVVGGPGLDGLHPLGVHRLLRQGAVRAPGRAAAAAARRGRPGRRRRHPRRRTGRAGAAHPVLHRPGVRRSRPRAHPRLRGARRRGAGRPVGGGRSSRRRDRVHGARRRLRARTRPPGGTCSPGTPAPCRRSRSRWSGCRRTPGATPSSRCTTPPTRSRWPVPAGVEVTWVHQGDARPGTRLVEAVRDVPWAGDDVHAFVHGEAAAVKELRRYLRVEPVARARPALDLRLLAARRRRRGLAGLEEGVERRDRGVRGRRRLSTDRTACSASQPAGPRR